MSRTLWYTRCPVPTASGIAYQLKLFDREFAGTGCTVRNIKELGRAQANTHFAHTLADSFREGGGSPPVWARSRGADTSLLGISFVEETLGLFVRADDPIDSVHDLAGKRLALPVWPDLIMNFFRFAAQKAFVSALELHGLREGDVQFVDVVETGDHHALINPGFADTQARQQPSYYYCQMRALLDGKVDAFFAKGGEIATMRRDSGGGIRMLYNLIEAEPMWAKVNNATPRLLTVSNSLVRERPDAVVRYARTLLKAATWAAQPENKAQATAAMARETGVTPADIDTYYTADIHHKLKPELSMRLIETLEVMKSFLHAHGFIEQNFSVRQWMAADLLREAYAAEGIPWID
ncbi:MAG: ABC transporter substrate-binding protein [Immundisolibacter sp.]